MQQFKQSESTAARRRFYLHLVDAGDGITPETGEAAGQPQISKNGAAFGNTSATLTAIGNGAYYVALTVGELDTLGVILVRYKSANTAEFQDIAYVVAYDPYDAAALGLSKLTALPADPASESGALAKDATVAKEASLAALAQDATVAKEATVVAVPAATDAELSGTHGAGSWESAPAADPWATPLPGVYPAGSAGKIIGDNLDAKVSDIPTDAELNTEHGSGSWEKGAEFTV